MNFKLLHPADQLIMMMERIYTFGMTTTSGGNLSIRDANGDVWITPASIDKGSLKREDIICVHPDGTTTGPHKPSSELPFHMSLYRKRADINAVVHAHPPALVAFSAVRRIPDTSLIPSAKEICGNIRIADYELPGSEKLGKNIADQFLPDVNIVILENHGVVVGKEDMFSAYKAFETLDFCARLHINALDMGTPRSLSADQLALSANYTVPAMEGFVAEQYSSQECEARRALVAFIRRAYRQGLFTATQGTYSQRLDGNNFVITPACKDRYYLEEEDFVAIRDGKCECGKTPDKTVMLHKAIYEKFPTINAVVVAQPPHIMAFGATEAEFDARLIPESYIMLKDVQRIPYGKTLEDPACITEYLSTKDPIGLIENYGVVIMGNSTLNAFDRLEVLEYSAKAVVATRKLGQIIKIDPERIDEIKVAFNLE